MTSYAALAISDRGLNTSAFAQPKPYEGEILGAYTPVLSSLSFTGAIKGASS
jgi:hypothetical protein